MSTDDRKELELAEMTAAEQGITDDEIRETLMALREVSETIPADIQGNGTETEIGMVFPEGEYPDIPEKSEAVHCVTPKNVAVSADKTKKKTRKTYPDSLFKQMVKTVIVPILLLMMVLSGLIAMAFVQEIREEVKQQLSYSAVAVEEIFTQLYPGELVKVDVTEDSYAICLGEHVLNEEDSLILDGLKEKTGMEYSYFYGTTRVLTTMLDEKQNRYVGSAASEVIAQDVLQEGETAFYNNAVISTQEYYAYYMPIFGQDGSCVGMIGVAKPIRMVREMQQKAMLPVALFILLAFGCVLAICMRYTKRVTGALGKVEKFLDRVAEGNLSTKMDRAVLQRKDEVGDMAKSSVSMQKSIRELVEKDALTTLHNRRYGEHQLKVLREQSGKTGIPYVLVIADIDHFKRVNDTYGHEGGDRVLRGVAATLKKFMRGRGVLARWGGEEFLLVFEDAELAGAAAELEKLRMMIEAQTIHYGDVAINVTMSFGAAQGSTDMDISSNLRQADECLYEAKQRGRNCIIVAE